LTGTQATTLIDTFTTSLKGLAPSSGGGTTNFLRADGTWAAPAGGGDMVLASAQTVSGAKTFNATTLLMRNVANTFNGSFTNTNTADRIYTLQNLAGTIAFTSDITGTNSGTNTGDQTITLTGGVTGSGTGSFATTVVTNANLIGHVTSTGNTTVLGSFTKAQLDTAVSDGNVLYVGDVTSNVTHTGDVTGATSLTIAAGVVTLAMQANIATARFFGRVTAATGVPEALTGTQATTLIDTFTTSLKGLAPSSGGGTTNFLRADGTWVTPSGGGDMVLASAQTVSGAKTFGTAGSVGRLIIAGATSGSTILDATSIAGSGTVTLPTTGTLATLVGTETLSNKRITPRIQSVTNAATITPNINTDDLVDITAIAQNFTIANPSGTSDNCQKLIVRVKDNGTARTITFGADYVAGGVSLPTTTILSKILTLGFIYNTANSLNKWQLVALAQEA